jgi:hypothetical protein
VRRLPLVLGGMAVGFAPVHAMVCSTRTVPGFVAAFGFKAALGTTTSPTLNPASSAARSPLHAARCTMTENGQGVAATSVATCAGVRNWAGSSTARTWPVLWSVGSLT